MNENIEHKSVVCTEVKAERKDTNLYIEGYGAYFGNVDSYGDVIRAGAFANFLASDDVKRIKLCWQHNFDDVIGVIEEMKEDERGLWFRAKISNTMLGKDAATLIEDGALNEFSIGYGVKAAEYPEDRASGIDRILTDVYLYEISLVSRAANPKATLEDSERKGEETKQIINQNPIEMEEELKKQIESMGAEVKGLRDENAKLEAAINEVKADKEAIDGIKSAIEKNDEAIKNLDESIKKIYDEMKERKDEGKTPAQAVCEAIKSEEFKILVSDVVAGKRTSGIIEVKLDTSSMTGTILRTVGDNTVNADAQQRLVFLPDIRRKDVPQDKSVALWVEGNFTDNTDYVGEGAEVTNAEEATAEEKTRGLAKIGAKLPFTRETSTDLSYFLNWARGEAITAVQNKVDNEILRGEGADTNATTKKKIYGIIGQGSVEFDATAAGLAGAFTAPSIIELTDAVDAQVYKTTNDAFYADRMYINPSDFAKYKNMKGTDGQLLFESNGGIYTFLGKRVIRTNKIAADTLLYADSGVFDLHEKLGLEIEIERKAATDSYVMYLRWRGQFVVPGNKKKAVVYIPSITTALAAITQ